MFKKVMSLICATCMLVSMSIPAFAQNTKTDISSIPEEKILNIPDNASHVEVGDAEYIRTPQGNIFKISELPVFSTREEADAYINNLKESVVISLLFLIITLVLIRKKIYEKILNISFLKMLANFIYKFLYIIAILMVYLLPSILCIISFVVYIKL